MKTINKLIRDNIPQIILNEGKIPHFYKIEDNYEFYNHLCQKLMEETNEFLENKDIKELVDILEVIEAIIEYNKIDYSTIAKLKKEKVRKNGKFKKRLFLTEIE